MWNLWCFALKGALAVLFAFVLVVKRSPRLVGSWMITHFWAGFTYTVNEHLRRLYYLLIFKPKLALLYTGKGFVISWVHTWSLMLLLVSAAVRREPGIMQHIISSLFQLV